MNECRLSNTYRLLYKEIIEDLLYQITNSGINYCMRSVAMPAIIGEEFEKYKEKASGHMSRNRLDRHKLASCICGAIIKAQPLAGYQNARIVKQANEILALHAGMNVVKFYMMYHYIDLLDITSASKKGLKNHMKNYFEMRFPSREENICDAQEYKQNLQNALYWTRQTCDRLNAECIQYDIWAYAKIFYHLELYNRDAFEAAYQDYLKSGQQ